MTKSGTWRALCVAVAALGLLGAAACGDDDDDSSNDTTASDSGDNGTVVESAQALCDGLETLDTTVQDINADPETTTIADIQQGLDELSSDVSDVASSGSALAGALGTALESAFERFQSAVEGLPEDETLRAAGEAAQSAAEEFDQAWNAALDSLNCERAS
jgi:hypothetical protein